MRTAWRILQLHAHYWNVYSHTISISIWMVVLVAGYVLRIDLLFRLRASVLDYIYLQFKIDCAVIVITTCYYAVSYLFEHHFANNPEEIAIVCLGSIALWAFVLWQIENRIANHLPLSSSSYVGVVFLVLMATVIELPAFSMLNQVNTVLQPVVVPEDIVLYQPPKYHSKPHPKAEQHALSSTFNHTVIIILLACIILGMIIYFALAMKRGTNNRTIADSEPGSMTTTKRIKLSQQRRTFIKTNQPMRLRVQKWQMRLDRRRRNVQQSSTIRAVAMQTGNDEIGTILSEYERVRYDPDFEYHK